MAEQSILPCVFVLLSLFPGKWFTWMSSRNIATYARPSYFQKCWGFVSIVISLDLCYVVEVLNTEVFLLFKLYFNNIHVGFMYKEIKSLVDWFLIWYPPWLQWRPVPALAACVFWNISIKASRSLPLVYILLIIEDLIRQLNCVVCIKCALLCTY